MKKPTLPEQLRYRFDNFMSHGTIALVAALFAVTFCLVLTAAAILVISGLGPGGSTQHMGIAEAIWQITMRTIDTGTVAGDSGWSFRLVSFLVTIGGIFIVSALIGVLASGLEGRLNELRRGRSRVLESGHTIILGWSPQVFTIINELGYAHRNPAAGNAAGKASPAARRRAIVAILADRDKLEMEDEIRTKTLHIPGIHVVCRSGNPLDPDDLQIVNPEAARAIIVLSPGGPYPDMPVAKALMALTRDRDQRAHRYHIVAAVQRPTNLELFRMIGGEEARIFLVDRLIAHLIAQTCRQSGLSLVFSELFSFEGAVICVQEIPALASVTYGEALYRLDNSALMGLQYRDGKSQLNPPMDTRIQPGDRLIVVAGAGDALQLTSNNTFEINAQVIHDGQAAPAPIDRLLILGWNRRAPMILEQLSRYLPPGSQVNIYAPYSPEQMRADCGDAVYHPMRVHFEGGNPLDRPSLEIYAAENYSIVVILSPTEQADIQLADAATMIPLMHLRDISNKSGQKLSIVSEILDIRNRALADVTSADDVIISEQLVALALTQMAENKDAVPVFMDLLSMGGAEIYLKPVGNYILPGSQVNFYTILAAAQRKDETAIGYRLLAEADEAERSFGVYLNPDKSRQIVFGEEDQVIIIATSDEGAAGRETNSDH